MSNGGRIEGRFAVVKVSAPTEVLQVQILLNLQCHFFVGVMILLLQRPCHIAREWREEMHKLLFDFCPWDHLSFLYPAVISSQVHTHWLLKICHANLSILVAIHARSPKTQGFD